MKRKLMAASLLVVVTASILFAGWSRASVPSPDTLNIWKLVGLCAVAAVFLVLIARAGRRRQPALAAYLHLLTVCILIAAAIPVAYSEYRFAFTKRALTHRYEQLSKKGPPFPRSRKAAFAKLTDQRLVERGYWVSDDRKAFELFYHIGSDSRTLPYPTGKWQWRGTNYQGPKTSSRDAKQ